MENADLKNYPEHEQSKLSQLNALLTEWYENAKSKTFINGLKADDLVFDGFYPYFTEQPIKILFIGRESLGLSGTNYINLMHHLYKTEMRIGDKSLNQSQFHALMLRVNYALNKNTPWEDVPDAMTIAQDFAEPGGTSFAFMNLSKLSNESEDSYQADWPLIDCFTNAFKDEETNFFNKQIEIIDPDIIITMNLESRLNLLGEITVIGYEKNAGYCSLRCSDREIPVMDLYHFSAVKSHKETFYDPVVRGMQVYKKLKDELYQFNR